MNINYIYIIYMILVCAVMKISEVECRWPGWRIWEDFSLMRWSFLMLLPQGDMRCAVTMLQTAVSFYTQVLRWFATYAQCVPVMSCLLLVQTSLVLTSWDILRYLDISRYILIYLDISWSSWPQVNEHSIVEARLPGIGSCCTKWNQVLRNVAGGRTVPGAR